jgi:MurNAc alpha-1-phosphate uridylyltransferase
MVLAAGLGKRMRPLTDHRPKPMISVAGIPLIDRGLDQLAAANIDRAVVNVHYLAAQIESHLVERQNPKIIISDERQALLETGGGMAKALPLLGAGPFVLLNADSFWQDAGEPSLQSLIDRWDDTRMDILLLLADPATSIGFDGAGDFHLDAAGRLTRRSGDKQTAWVYTGVAIVHPRCFADAPDGAFSFNIQFDAAISKGRLFGQVLNGTWFHVGTPDAIGEAEAALAAGAT